MAKPDRIDSKGLLDVVAGVSEFVHKLFCMVMAARFEVELDTADLDRVFKIQAIMEDWKEKAFLEVALPITPSLQYSNAPDLGERSQLAWADFDSKGLAGRRDLHFFQAPLLGQSPGSGARQAVLHQGLSYGFFEIRRNPLSRFDQPLGRTISEEAELAFDDLDLQRIKSEPHLFRGNAQALCHFKGDGTGHGSVCDFTLDQSGHSFTDFPI
jgi:hypothetical protein